jgi:RimJ/RimL family protein N-acetyltransferase
MSISITNLNKNDLPEILKWAEDERTLLQWCGPVFDFPLTIEQLDDYFSESQNPEPGRLIFKAVEENGRLAGMCELGAVDRKNEICSLCRIFVDKSFRGRGIAEFMISKVLDIGFYELNLSRIELNVYTYNTPAFKCYEKLGFQREGLKRKVTKYKNEYWDGYIYGLLKEDWEKVKPSLANFK